jgi:hypothetical protein
MQQYLLNTFYGICHSPGFVRGHALGCGYLGWLQSAQVFDEEIRAEGDTTTD